MTEAELSKAIKEAMLAKEVQKLSVLRMLQAAVTNKRKEKGADSVSEEELMELIKKQVKQRKDSIEAFEKGGRPELAESEKKELEILQNYLPAELPAEEIEKVVLAKKEELGITDKSGMGKLMGACMSELKSKGVDGGRVKEMVEKVLG
ncbi:MAG: GatB/YqeY domain-containing protein [Candidatus Gracilibacteria bacterium]|nr:GatB/YqeY domain-containing protein [Candidatus Gracilibacteria bacterium]